MTARDVCDAEWRGSMPGELELRMDVERRRVSMLRAERRLTLWIGAVAWLVIFGGTLLSSMLGRGL